MHTSGQVQRRISICRIGFIASSKPSKNGSPCHSERKRGTLHDCAVFAQCLCFPRFLEARDLGIFMMESAPLPTIAAA
jgi:hypothetical protein